MEQVKSERMLAGFDDVTAKQVASKESACATAACCLINIGVKPNKIAIGSGACSGRCSASRGCMSWCTTRGARVLAHGIGIRGVLDACHRQGSLDAAIRKANDLASLREHVPLPREVYFNGRTAGRQDGRMAGRQDGRAVRGRDRPGRVRHARAAIVEPGECDAVVRAEAGAAASDSRLTPIRMARAGFVPALNRPCPISTWAFRP